MQMSGEYPSVCPVGPPHAAGDVDRLLHDRRTGGQQQRAAAAAAGCWECHFVSRCRKLNTELCQSVTSLCDYSNVKFHEIS